MNKLVLSIGLFLFAQTITWFQTNGQFVWKWFHQNPLILSITGGTIISYTFILGTGYAYEYFGTVWPGRFLAFSMGISSYALLTWLIMGEGITIKTAISLLLTLCIVCIQIFWK